MAIVTVQQAAEHLRIDLATAGSPPVIVDERLSDLQLKIDQAEALVLDYLKLPATFDPDGSPEPWSERERRVVEAAVLLALEALYDAADGRTIADYLRPTGTIGMLLARLRSPALA